MTQKRKLSISHVSFKKRKKKKVCPGCGGEFVDRHFETHKVNFLWDNKWTCRKSNTPRTDVQTDNEPGTSNLTPPPFEDQFPADYKDERPLMTVKRKLKERLQIQSDELPNDLEDDNEEFWANVTLNDIDTDFGSGTDDDRNEVHEKREPAIFKKATTIFHSICIFLCCWQSFYIVTDAALGSLLSFLVAAFRVLTAENIALTGIASLLPCSVYMLYKNLGLKKDHFTKYVICKKCHKLYNYDECIINVEGQKTTKKCWNVLFPNHRQVGRRVPCGEPLLKTVILNSGEKKLYPFKTFCYKSVQETLSTMVKQPKFEENCEKWRQRRQELGIMTDVYDGKIWKEFGDEGKKNFLKSERNYGLMLNLDWFQPFEHVKYSVGVIYAVVLNLPRTERFKLQNVFLIGIIPDMSVEPPVHSFISPFVDEMKIAWENGFSMTSFKSPKTNSTFKLACMCVGCDIPATRKLCGFLGHGATLGCSKCSKTFPGDIGKKNYGGFDVRNWTPRTLQEHHNNLAKIKSATTQTDKEKLESKYGIRFSPLCTLEYFDPIRMSIIDPMHNFYQGTAKKMVKMWLELKVLDNDKLKEIQERVDSVNVATNVGSLPRKIASAFGGFTADQWKNWTNIFSIFALKDVIPSTDLEVWRKFVLASRCVATKIISTVDIIRYERLILDFCREFEELYGDTKVTPNIHLHYHLAECIRDYGPIYSFWLFSFERYNGHLGSMPNNNRSIELQIMRRFLRDSFVNSLELPLDMKDTLDKSIHLKETNRLSLDIHTSGDVSSVMYMSKRNAPIINQPWDNIKPYYIPKTAVDRLTNEQHRALKLMYEHIYPEINNKVIPMSCRKCNVIYIGNEILGSWDSRQRRSSYVMAYWNSLGGNIIREAENAVLTPGIVKKFIVHNLIINGENHVHLLAKINWFLPLPVRYRNYCGEPVEAWNSIVSECFGPSSYMPVQRIYCRFLQAEGAIGNKMVAFVVPLNNGLNI